MLFVCTEPCTWTLQPLVMTAKVGEGEEILGPLNPGSCLTFILKFLHFLIQLIYR